MQTQPIPVTTPDFAEIGRRAYWRRDALRWQGANLSAAVELVMELAAEVDFSSEDLPTFVNGRTVTGALSAVAGALRSLQENIHAVLEDDDGHLPLVSTSGTRLSEQEIALALRWAQCTADAWNGGALDEALLDAISSAMVRDGLKDLEGSR